VSGSEVLASWADRGRDNVIGSSPKNFLGGSLYG
jgi:hypothetical protein